MKKLVVVALMTFSSMAVNSSEIDNTKITRTMMDSNFGEKLFIQVSGTPVRVGGALSFKLNLGLCS